MPFPISNSGLEPETALSLSSDFDDVDDPIIPLASVNSVHDRTQFETKFDFDLLSDSSECTLKRYEIETYLFIPNTVGINSDTYRVEDFYGDLTHLMRVRTPELERAPGQPLSLPRMAAVDEYLKDSLDSEERDRLRELAIHEIKLLGCFLYTELKKLQKQVHRATERKSSNFMSRYMPRLERGLEMVHRELRNYRQVYMRRVHDENLLLENEVRRAFLLVDEYLSYRLESALVNISQMLGPPGPANEDVLNQCEALLTGETHYREGNITQGRTGAETHYYRLGLLKKYISEVLFLKTRRVKRDYVYRNAIAAFGASLAAAFATLAQIQTAYMVRDQDDSGWRLLFLVCLGVVVYVFKDRIKDLTKEHFNARLKNYLPDYDVELSYRHFDSQGKAVESVLGHSKEFCRYMSRSSVGSDVLFLRDLGHQADLEPERFENVIYYNKRLEVPMKEHLREHFGDATVRRIHDVLRYDISAFLAKMDNPRKNLTYFNPDKGISTIEAPKIYHVNLVFRYTVSEWNQQKRLSSVVEVERVRVIINKKGIVRIQTVIPRGEFGYRE